MSEQTPNYPFHMWKEALAQVLRKPPHGWGGCAYQVVDQYNAESLSSFWSNGATPEAVAEVITGQRLSEPQPIRKLKPLSIAKRVVRGEVT